MSPLIAYIILDANLSFRKQENPSDWAILILRNRKYTTNEWSHFVNLSGPGWPGRRGHNQQQRWQSLKSCLEFKIALYLLSVFLGGLHFLVAAFVWEKYFVKTLRWKIFLLDRLNFRTFDKLRSLYFFFSVEHFPPSFCVLTFLAIIEDCVWTRSTS